MAKKKNSEGQGEEKTAQNPTGEKSEPDLFSHYEINIKALTFLFLIGSLKKENDTILTIEDLENFIAEQVEQKREFKLPPHYSRIACEALKEENKHKSEDEIIQDLGNLGFVSLRANSFFQRNKTFYIPANSKEREINNTPCYYYDLSTDIIITKSNTQYAKLFAFKLLCFGLDEIDAFLDYQLNKYFINDITAFGRFLEVLLKAQKDKLNTDIAYIVSSWVEMKRNINNKGQAKGDSNDLLTRKRQVLMMYFLFKTLGIQRANRSVASLARFAHALLGWPVSDIDNSQVYKFLKQAPYLKGDKSLETDLLYVKKQFENIGLIKAANMIENEIQLIDKKR